MKAEKGRILSLPDENNKKEVLAIVTKSQTVKPGKGGAFNNLELVTLLTKRKMSMRLRSDQNVEKVGLDPSIKATVLYIEGSTIYLMNSETFDSIELSTEIVEKETLPFVMDNVEIEVELYNGEPIGLALPPKMRIEVKHTEVQTKNATKDASTKPGILANDVTIQIPPFVDTGDFVFVCPSTKNYLGRG